jgi:hypothetical protein
MKTWTPVSLRFFAVGEWLLILPAGLLLAVAALRLLQPPQFEPARTMWEIFRWTTPQISRLGAGILFLGMPSVVLFVGCLALWKAWYANQGFRDDVASVAAILRRRAAFLIVTAAALLAAAVLTLVVGHIVTD